MCHGMHLGKPLAGLGAVQSRMKPHGYSSRGSCQNCRERNFQLAGRCKLLNSLLYSTVNEEFCFIVLFFYRESLRSPCCAETV